MRGMTRWILPIALVGASSIGCRSHDKPPAASAKAPAAAPAASPAKKAPPAAASTEPKPPAIEDAIAQAKASHKPLIAEFYTSWCHPCQIFAKTTLVDPRVKTALGDVELVRYDAEADPGIAAAARYGVSSYPTFLAIDREGTVRRRSSGVATGEDGVTRFLAFIHDAETSTLDEADVKARIAAHPADATIRLTSGRWYADRGLADQAAAQYDAVAASAAATPAERATARGAAQRMRRIARWKRELVAEKLAEARAEPGSIGERDLAIATVDSGASPAEIRDVFAKVFAAQTDPLATNQLLYVALAAGAADQALDAAKQRLGASKDPNLLDTLAECYHVHGDRADALKIEDHALSLAGSAASPGLTANRKRFAAGNDEASEVTAEHAMVAKLWSQLAHVDLDAPQEASAASSSSQTDPQAAQAMEAYSATMKLGTSVGAACAAKAGKTDGAFAQVTLDPAGKVTASTLYLEDGASPELRACLTAQLAAATLPVVSGMHLPPIQIAFKAGS